MTSKDNLGMGSRISRRDFVNGSLVAAGALTLGACTKGAPAGPNAPSGSAWTGPGGEGDYAWSNGNTQAVRDAAHGVRDGAYDEALRSQPEETYDLVIVGGGPTGLTAAHEVLKAAPSSRILLLENHPVPGGEAKQNEIRVDGVRLVGPQGANACGTPAIAELAARYPKYAEVYQELGIPQAFELQPTGGGAEALTLSNDHFEPAGFRGEWNYPTGYFFKDKGWSKDPIRANFSNTAWSPSDQQQLSDFVHNRRDLVSQQADPDRWLDTMTYAELLRKLKYNDTVIDYVDPLLCPAYAASSEVFSARAARSMGMPGTVKASSGPQPDPPLPRPGTPEFMGISFPGGNTGIVRALLWRMVPDLFPKDAKIADVITYGKMNLAALDRAGAPLRIRTSSTAVRVEHDGDPKTAGRVFVTYVRDGKVRRVAAKSVIMATGGWITRRVVRDFTPAYTQAFGGLQYGPIMVVNVAVRNWRWFEKLGFANARLFNGLAWHVCVRRNFALGPEQRTLTPDSPLMLTFYIPVLMRGQAPDAQTALGRMKMLDTPYADIERQIREQMTEVFGPSGFDARRDIAGIVVNRWGHALATPRPGYFYGKEGEPPPVEVIRKPHGRVIFAHSEWRNGVQTTGNAMEEAALGARQALDVMNA